MKISETFISVQGEGLDVGKQTVFVRLTGCNLACKWCDTEYASRPGSEFEAFTPKEIMGKVDGFNIRSLSITGGEPLLQRKELIKLCELAQSNSYFIDIQTNGTLYEPLLAPLINRFSVSPKLKSSGNHFAKRFIKEVWFRYIEQYKKYRNVSFKFVIQNKEDRDEALELLSRFPAIRNIKLPIILQPEISLGKSEDLATQVKSLKQLIEDNIMNDLNRVKWQGYNLFIIPQIHKYCWGNKRAI